MNQNSSFPLTRESFFASVLIPAFAGMTFVSTLLLTGCAKKEEAPAAPALSDSAAQSSEARVPDLSTAGILKGVVRFEGEAPAPSELSVGGNPECAVFHAGGKVKSEELIVMDGKLANAFIYIKTGLEGYSFTAPTEPVTMDNKSCLYVPHVSGAQVGQPVIFLNSDPTLHNIHSYSKNSKGFNLGLPFQGMKQTKKFDVAEVMIGLKCDVHPWMQGYLGVLNHPYFAVTKEDGAFELKNIPAGEYTIEVWHEKLGVQSQTIKIEPQSTKEIEFTFTS